MTTNSDSTSSQDQYQSDNQPIKEVVSKIELAARVGCGVNTIDAAIKAGDLDPPNQYSPGIFGWHESYASDWLKRGKAAVKAAKHENEPDKQAEFERLMQQGRKK